MWDGMANSPHLSTAGGKGREIGTRGGEGIRLVQSKCARLPRAWCGARADSESVRSESRPPRRGAGRVLLVDLAVAEGRAESRQQVTAQRLLVPASVDRAQAHPRASRPRAY